MDLKNNKKLLSYFIAVGVFLMFFGVVAKVVWADDDNACGLGQCGEPGERLDLIDYLVYEDGNVSQLLGPYIGVYSVNFTYCPYLYENPDSGLWGCWHHGDDYWTDPSKPDWEWFTDTSTGRGYGILYLSYTNENLGDFIIPELRILVPLSSGSGWTWNSYKLNGFDSVAGHTWQPTPVTNFGGSVSVRSVLADYDYHSALFPNN